MATGILTANALDPRLTLQSHSATLGLTCNLVPQPPCAPPPQVDGGVSAANIAEIAEAGADMFVAGSAIFNQPDYKKVIDDMRSELAQVPVPGKK